MTNSRYNILVPMDFSEHAEYALNQAIKVAKLTNGLVHLLYIHQDKKGVLSKLFLKEHSDLFDEAVMDKLEKLSKEKSLESDLEITFDLQHGHSVASKIVEVANIKKSAMIVMGKGRLYDEGVERFVIGSVTSRVIRYSKVPVITTGNECDKSACKNIMLPLDLSKETRQKVSWGIQMAKIFGANIKVVSALWDKNDPEIVSPLTTQMKQVKGFISDAGIEVSTTIVNSSKTSKDLVSIMMDYIKREGDIDMVLIMTQQENEISSFFLGSTATEFIRKSPVPVMSIIPRETGEIVLGL